MYNNKRFWFRKGVMFVILFIGAVLLFGMVVMFLWNAILPAVLHVSTITFAQALGILVLSKILFGGFKGGNRRPESHHKYNQDSLNRWMHMSREERFKMRDEWKERSEPITKQE